MYTRNEKVVPVYIEEEMKDSYINYAMSVIVGRALPDVKDGLKPVHRRILYAMKDLSLEHNKAYKKSARIVGECFVKDTLVLTGKGLVPIQDVKQGEEVYTQNGRHRVTELYKMPPKGLLKVRLANGTCNIVTPSQKFKVINRDFKFEWKKAKDLTSEDYIVLKAAYPKRLRKERLQKLDSANPSSLNEDLAYFLGIFMAEGYIERVNSRTGTYRISVACNSREVIEKARDILLKEFDYVSNIEEKGYLFKDTKGESAVRYKYTLRINRNYINRFLVENFSLAGLKAPDKDIPWQIFKSPESVAYAFVSGLIDGDGSVHKNRSVIHYGSVSEKLVNKLQLLLQHLGIFSSAYQSDKRHEKRTLAGRELRSNYVLHCLEFKGINAKILCSKVVLYNWGKNARAVRIGNARLKKSAFETIPYAGRHIFGELSAKHIGSGWYTSKSGEKFRAGVKYGTGCKIRYSKDLKEKPLRKSQLIEWGIKEKLEKISSPLYAFVNHIMQSSVYFMKVTSVTLAAAEPTYDIQVEGDHEFIANGMVSHNCLGKYHPHGDTAVYDTLVRMAQDFSLRYPLVDGQGNFGSVDGDAAAAMRYCVSGDSLIVTEKGLERIAKIKHHSDVSFNALSINNKINHVSKWFDSGEHSTKTIRTHRGFGLTGSRNHPILTWQAEKGKPCFKWKLLNKIQVGEYAVISRSSSLFPEKDPPLTEYYPAARKNQKTHKFPQAMNEDLAFVLGALVAEGSIGKGHIGFCNNDKKFIERYRESFKQVFPDCRLHEFIRRPVGHTRKIYRSLEIHSTQVREFLKNIGLVPGRARERVVPEIIFKSSKHSAASFLRAFAEGDAGVCISADQRSLDITFNSASGKLMEELQLLLLRFGIDSSYRRQNTRDIYKLFIRNHTNLNLFREQIGFFTQRKQTKLSGICSRNESGWAMSKTDYIPYIAHYIRKKAKRNGYNYKEGKDNWLLKHNIDRYTKIKKYWSTLNEILDREDRGLYKTLKENEYIFDKIVSVENSGTKRVYSIKVDSPCHSFVSNGFISHNTEAKLEHITDWLLADIEKNTVNFVPNFDNSLEEPSLLPAAFPNLMVNGSSGIAVGMATNIPPHNLSEVADGITHLIENPGAAVKDLMKKVKGPDFPTGGIICGREGIKKAYETGRGRLLVHAKAQVEEQKNGKENIVITEIPYQVNKNNLISSMANLVQDRKIEGISNLRDESDKDGMRIVVELKRGQNSQVILNQLYKHTQMQTTYGAIMLALVDNRPRVLNLKEILSHYIDHRKEIITRRTKFDKEKAEARAHILEGLKIALKNLDRVIAIIKKSKSPQEAKAELIKRFKLSARQAQAILEMQLQRLTGLERDKIDAEYKELIKKIAMLEAILASKQKVLGIIKDELAELKKKFGDERRTELMGEVEDLDMEDLIQEEDVVITISHSGYIKRLPVSAYRKQKRGGKGVSGAGMREEDFIEDLFVASTHDNLLFFTNQGKAYAIKVYDIPQTGRTAKGKAIVNMLSMSSGEQITSSIAVKEFTEGSFLMMATKTGKIKKTALPAFANIRKSGIIAISLEENDSLISAKLTTGKDEVFIATKEGKAVRFSEKDIRNMGRSARGVRGINLGKQDSAIGMEIITDKKVTLLSVTENGFSKRTEAQEYRIQSRGGKGIINLRVTAKNGPVVGLKLVSDQDEVMIMTGKGMVVRCAVKDIRATGRSAQGVRMIKLGKAEKVASVARVIKEE